MSAYHQMEYVMSFLMGLNESYAQIRGPLLLMDHLPPINKVFSLISQEEHQQKIGTSLASDVFNSAAFAMCTDPNTKLDSNGASFTRGPTTYSNGNNGHKGRKKERPLCTHYNSLGHTIDRCYKLHGYPPGYKPRPKENRHGNSVNQVVNAVALADDQPSGQVVMLTDQPEVGNFLQNLSSRQYHQLMSMLSHHLAFFSPSTSSSL